MSTPDNPAAFPRPTRLSQNPQDAGDKGAEGMTLRDWFAGQALAGVIADFGLSTSADRIATACGEIADAMLAERAKGGDA